MGFEYYFSKHFLNLVLSSIKDVAISKLFHSIRDFPDHATFREKGAKLACADKLGVFLSLTLCKKANFDPLQ